MIRLFADVPKSITVTQIDCCTLQPGMNQAEPLETIWIIGRRLSPARCLHVARKQHGFKTVIPQTLHVDYCTVTIQIQTEKEQAKILPLVKFTR